MKTNSIDKVKNKHRAWRKYMRTKEYTDYLLFARARNQAKRECIKERKLFERMVAKEVKIIQNISGNTSILN